MPHQTTFFILLAATTILAKPEGFYHQEYQYKQSSSSYKNNELQHNKNDEGFYTKDGDLTGTRDPKVNEQHEHREFINPKLRAQGYTAQDFHGGAGIDLHERAQQLLGKSASQDFTTGYSSAYNQQKQYGARTSGMQSFMADLQYDMQRQLEHQLQQWRQEQEEYSSAQARQQRYSSTSSGLYSPSTASVDTMRRELQEEIRTNLTREIDLRNRISQYDSTDLAPIKQQLQENLMRQLNDLMREQQSRQLESASSTGGSSLYATRGASSSIKTKMNYSPASTTDSQYSSYEQDDLNKQHRHYQQRPTTMVPEQYQHTPPSSSSYGSSLYSSSSQMGSSQNARAERPTSTPIVRNANQITEIAQQVQNDMQQVLIKALEQYQRENSFNPSNKYQTKPDYNYARQDFESRIQYNLTEHFRTMLDRQFGAQDLRGQYYFSQSGGTDQQQQQRYANYKRDDYNLLKQQVQENLRQFLRDSLKTQQDYFETQQRAHAATSSLASYTSSGQQSQPHRDDYYSRPSGEQASRSYSSSSSYSGSAAYQTESRPQRTGASYTKTYHPPSSGYRTTSDTTAYGTFAKYQGGGGSSAQYASSPGLEDCDENMQGDDPNAYFNHQRDRVQSTPSIGNLAYYQQRPYSYSDALRKPVDFNDDFQRPVNSMEDYQRPVSEIDDFQRPVSSMEDYQRPVSEIDDFQRPVERLNTYRKPSSALYDSEGSFYQNPSTRLNRNWHQNGQFSVNSADYDDDIQRVSPFGSRNRQIDSASAKNTLLGGEDLFNVLLKPVQNLGISHQRIPNGFSTSTTERNEGNDRINEIAQKLKDSVEEFHDMHQQKTLSDDLEQFRSSSSEDTKFDSYGTTEDNFSKQNEDLLRVISPQTYYKPFISTDVMSSTPLYNIQTSTTERPVAQWFEANFVQKTTPKYNSFNRQPVNIENSRSYYDKRTSTEAPTIIGPDSDMLQQHLADSYEDFEMHAIKPKLNQITPSQVRDNQRYGVTNQLSQQLKPSQQNLDNPKPFQGDTVVPKKYPEDEEFLDNILRQPKAIYEDNEEIEDFQQRPINDNLDVISSHRGDIDSLSQVNNNNQQNRDLPIRLADITRHQNDPNRLIERPTSQQHSDHLQRPVEDLQWPIEDLQRPIEDLQRPVKDLQWPIEDLDDLQRPVNEYDDYDQIHEAHARPIQRQRGHLIQHGRRLPEVSASAAEAPLVEVFENIQKHEVKPVYLSSDNDVNLEESALESLNNSTEKPGFWRHVGGKISNTYNNAKQKARDFVGKINLL